MKQTDIWSVRNRIAHGYVHIDRAIIVATVENDLGEFARDLDLLEEHLGKTDPPDG